MSLLDQNVTEYVFEYEDAKSEWTHKVFDHDSNLMGKTKSWANNRFAAWDSLLDLDDNTICTVKYRFRWTPVEVEDGQGKFLGKIRKKSLGTFEERFRDHENQEILFAKYQKPSKTDSKIPTFNIKDVKGNEIAKFTIYQEESKQGFLKNSKWKTTCTLQIIDVNFNRTLILSLFLVSLNDSFNAISYGS